LCKLFCICGPSLEGARPIRIYEGKVTRVTSIRKVLLFMEEQVTTKNVVVGENIVLYFFLFVMLSSRERERARPRLGVMFSSHNKCMQS